MVPRAVASKRPTEALALVISFAFVVYSHHKHSKYLGSEFNNAHCLSYIFFMDIASVVSFSGYGTVSLLLSLFQFVS